MLANPNQSLNYSGVCWVEFSVSGHSNLPMTPQQIQVVRHLDGSAVYCLSGFSWTTFCLSVPFLSAWVMFYCLVSVWVPPRRSWLNHANTFYLLINWIPVADLFSNLLTCTHTRQHAPFSHPCESVVDRESKWLLCVDLKCWMVCWCMRVCLCVKSHPFHSRVPNCFSCCELERHATARPSFLTLSFSLILSFQWHWKHFFDTNLIIGYVWQELKRWDLI